MLYATNLGWPDDADPGEQLGLDHVDLVVNDAVAAALGESVLRGRGRPEQELIYVSLGTGVGSAYVAGGVASEVDLGHHFIGGTAFCDGCRSAGCLNSELAARRLPPWLEAEDQTRVARTLASALVAVASDAGALVIVGGGIARRYPGIVATLDRLVPNVVQPTSAPAGAKSAAYAGLDYLVSEASENGVRGGRG